MKLRGNIYTEKTALQKYTISDFFSSAKETAKEIDEKRKVTRKNIIWVDPIDLMAILKPERTKIEFKAEI